MSFIRPGHIWDESYAGEAPPWDIGRPQEAFVRLAEAGLLSGDLLDAGCGTGEHTILAARHGATARGIDISPRAIAAAQAKGSDATFEVMDVLLLGDLGPTFDTVVDSGCMHVFDDEARSAYVAGVHTVLRPGGHLYLMCFSDLEPGDWGPHRFTSEELRSVFSEGWENRSVEADHFDINPVGDVTRAAAWRLDVVRSA